MAWAFALLDDRKSGDVLFCSPSFSTCCVSKEAEFTIAAKRQLHFWSQWREELNAPWPALPITLVKRRTATSHENGQT
eukprot:CAMPEP_0119317826 /NCGR_PEP_ID=MMETSP1333-20130426/44491_1 /TAXON_ID=418940 /ORGANISM="Scyphosphaera apsteinii, Strain RCC1455" /LENGTH=77 /DNA_ID=CAMNT_0007323885 /DNA_START=16 /DNA_END=249 /DNA_ORIENTATION=-